MFFSRMPESQLMKIRQKTPPGFVMGMGNLVPAHGSLGGYLANSAHTSLFFLADGKKSRASKFLVMPIAPAARIVAQDFFETGTHWKVRAHPAVVFGHKNCRIRGLDFALANTRFEESHRVQAMVLARVIESSLANKFFECTFSKFPRQVIFGCQVSRFYILSFRSKWVDKRARQLGWGIVGA